MAACIIYLHVVAFGAVLLSGFWSLMNETFEPRSAKELFGRISGMGTLGGLCGGLLAERVAAWFGRRMSSWCSPCCTWRARACYGGHFPRSGLPCSPGPTTTIGAASPESSTRCIGIRFLLTLAGLVLAASSATALLDFVFKAQAAQTIGRGAPLLRFFGLYYTATSLLTFLLQTFLTRRCVKHAGLAASAGTQPASVAIGSLAGDRDSRAFQFLGGVRAMEILMRGSLYRSAYEMFYTAVAPADKRAVKSLIDVGADRAGDAVGSAGVSLMLVLAPGRYGAILGAVIRGRPDRMCARGSAAARISAGAGKEPGGPCDRA